MGATCLPPIGGSFLYIETNKSISGSHNNFCSSERAEIFQSFKKTFSYISYSILTNKSTESIGRFRYQLLLADNTWSTRYNIPKNDRYSGTSTEWTKLSLKFNITNYGNKLFYNQIDTPHADRCFSNNMIPHSVY